MLCYTKCMILTVDTGGTKTLVALFDTKGTITQSLRFATPATTEAYVEQLREIITSQFAAHDISAIVVALPGIIRKGVAVWCNNLGWTNFDAGKALAGVLGKTPVYIDNDANLAGLAEARSLSKVPVAALYVTVSTGIGTGFITDGKIDPGLRYSEGGRMLVEYDGVVREWETFASGKSIYTTYHRFASDITSKKSWEQIADRISRGFLAVIPLTQPEVIIIGGSIGTYFSRYKTPLTALLKQKLPPHIPCPRIVQAKHPEEAVVYGCYYYALDLAD